MTNKETCQCFICRHKNDKELLRAYLTGQIEADEQTFEELARIAKGNTPCKREEKLLKLLTCMEFDLGASNEYLEELGGKL